MHHVGIGAAHGAEQQPVAHRAAVDDEMDVARGAAVIGRQPDLAEQAQALAGLVDRHGVGGEIGAEHARGAPREPVLAVRLRRIGRRGEVVAGKREADLRVRHGKPAHDLGDRLRLGAVGFEELEPRRRRGEELGDLDPRALRRQAPAAPAISTPASTTIAAPVAASAVRVVIESRATAPIDGSASPRKPSVPMRDRSPSGSFEVAWRSTASSRSCGRHAGAVVDDADEPASAALDRDLDRAGAGVDRVLDQFLHGRRRALDHLARGDAVDEDGIEAADRGHARRLPAVGRDVDDADDDAPKLRRCCAMMPTMMRRHPGR